MRTSNTTGNADMSSSSHSRMILPHPPAPHDVSNHSITASSGPYRPPQLHRRSCNECGRRKVRCDRHQPCANCVKAGSECVFPVSRRAPVRKKKLNRGRNRDEELLNSIRRLQQQLQSTEIPESARESPADADCAQESAHDNEEPTSIPVGTAGPSPSTEMLAETQTPGKSESSVRLVLDHDRSRYISNSFWTSMSREIEEMHDILDGSSSEQEDDEPDQDQETPASTSRHSQSSRDLFIFSPIATSQALQSLYPSSSDLLTIFDVFLENVDPVVRIFHRPTLRTMVAEALPLLSGQLERHTEVVLFSISYAALTSLDNAECRRLFDDERRVLLPRYRYAVEQSLARARFLDSRNMAVLAALVLFLICVRRHDNSQFVSSLLGVVLRNAQAMGLHRDGTNFRLSPYETEMRRRLWWHICVLDIRASEDHGCDPSIYEQNYDTKFPLNINDEDISPKDTATPIERSAGSDMTFCLLRFEVSVAIRKLNYPAPIGSQEPHLSIPQKRTIVQAVEKHFYDQYINRCDITKPFDWVSSSWARLMLAKMWLAVSNPLGAQDSSGAQESGATMLPDLRSLAFEKSLEVLELSDQLETGHRAARWRWLFLTHVQWHAVVFVLAHLCVRPTDELSHRAWLVVDRACERWPGNDRAKKGMLWKPIRRLVDRAHQIRSAKLSSSGGELRGSGRKHRQSSNEVAMPPPLGGGSLTGTPHATRGASAAPQTHDSANETIDMMPPSQSGSYVPHLVGARQEGFGDNDDPGSSANVTGTNVATGSFGEISPQIDLSMQAQSIGVPPDAQTMRSDWSDTLHELQLVFQEDWDIASMNPEDAMEGYHTHLWNTL